MEKQHRFERFIKLIGDDAFTKLNSKCVLVLGVGGVGGYVCEALARSGVGKIVVVDYDTIDETNINRQIIALKDTVGEKKVDVLEKRIKKINDGCCVVKIDKFIDAMEVKNLFDYKPDYFVDACDTVATKKAVICECLKQNVRFISSMGAGNKLDPSKLLITDLRKTMNDPLARIMRKFIKDEGIRQKVMVLASTEVPIKTGERTPGSTVFVPASAGMLIASYVVRDLMDKVN